jgi:hypothetical protein
VPAVAGYTPATAGTYWWYASYAGDANNSASNSGCGTAMTSTVVGKTTTAATAAAPATGTAGTAIATTAIGSTLSGATTAATGTVTFTVFGPQASAPTTCTTGGTQVGTAVTVTGNATYRPSASFTPSSAGSYWWYASYSGDANNGASNSGCGAAMTKTVAYTLTSAASVTATSGAAATTSTFSVAPSTTYLLLVFRHSASGDGITSIASSGMTPALTTSSFTQVTTQTYNTADYQWAYYVTTGSGATGTSSTLTINFTRTLGSGQSTIVDLLRIGGNSTSAPVVTTNEGKATGSSATATANLPTAPGTSDAKVAFLSTNGNLGATVPTATPAMTNVFFSHQSAGSMGIYTQIPAQQNDSFAISSQQWGTMVLEIGHG